MERGFIGLNVAILAIGDASTVADEPCASFAADRLAQAGHRVVARCALPDDPQQIRAVLLEWIADAGIDIVIGTAGIDTEHGVPALEPLANKFLDGFTNLFRWASYESIGSAAMLVDAEAVLCKSTFVFLLPASMGAVQTALDKLLIPQLDYRTSPRNLVMLIPRIEHAAPPEAAPVAEPWITTRGAGNPRPQTAKLPTVAPPRPAVEPPGEPPVEPPVESLVEPPASAAVTSETSEVASGETATPPPRPKVPTEQAPIPLKPPGPIIVPGPSSLDDLDDADAVEPGVAAAEPPRRKERAPTMPPPIPSERGATIPRSSRPATAPSAAASQAAAVAAAAIAPETVVVDESLVNPIDMVTAQLGQAQPKKPRLPDPPLPYASGTNGASFRTTFQIPRLSEPRRKSSAALITVTLALAAAAAVLIGVVMLRRPDRTAEHGERVATSTELGTAPRAGEPPTPTGEPSAPDVRPAANTAAGGNPFTEPPPQPEPEIEMEAMSAQPRTRPIGARPPTTPVSTNPDPEPTPPQTTPSAPPTTAPATRPRPAPPATPEPAEEPPENNNTQECDEVSCILDRYSRPCCARFKPAEGVTPAGPSKPSSGLPEKLDRRMIQAGISQVKPAVIRCGEQFNGKGTVNVHIQVTGDGAVTGVTVKSAPTPALGTCVADALGKAKFPATDGGGSFGYPFVF